MDKDYIVPILTLTADEQEKVISYCEMRVEELIKLFGDQHD